LWRICKYKCIWSTWSWSWKESSRKYYWVSTKSK